MSRLNSINLNNIIGQRFNISMEHDQEIEINAEEVIINSDLTLDGEIEELAEDTDQVTEAVDNIEDVEATVATLEALIASMESSVVTGGFDKRNAMLANISLEAISNRFGLESNILSFGMEEVEDDAEAETKATVGKAKQMLGALKASTGALINKMYNAAASALGNNAAISAKLVSKATSLQSSVNSENKGGNSVKLSRGVKRKLTIDGTTVLSPDEYVKEFKRLTDKYNTVVKAYADSDLLGAFASDALRGMNGTEGEPQSKKVILSTVKTLAEGVTKSAKGGNDLDVNTSDKYLGGATITATRPTADSILAALNGAVKKDQVSQEGIGNYALGTAQLGVGAAIFTLCGFICLPAGAIGLASVFSMAMAAIAPAGAVGVATAAATATATTVTGVSALAGAGIGLPLAIIAGIGGVKSNKLKNDGAEKMVSEISSAYNSIKGKFKGTADEASLICTEFELDTNGVSMESDEQVTVTSLSASQIGELTTIIKNTAATTQNMKKMLNQRKAVMSSVDKITKALAKEDKEANNPLTKATATFLKQFIKQTIKFEMDLTTYSVNAMKAALVYAEASNNSKSDAEPEANDDDEKKTVA